MENLTRHITPEEVTALAAIAGEANVVTASEDLEKLSRDYYWFSPLLKEIFESKRASVAVKVNSVDVLTQVIAWCSQEAIPLVIRGGGTGNYGQCVPLYGGVLVDITGMDRILKIGDGEATVEAGVRIETLERRAREQGLEMRCKPSTWVKSTVAGFLCGGSGGIGSVTYGGTGYGGMVKQMKLLTIEPEPKLLTFDEGDALRALNTFGTTGVVTEITLRMAPMHRYDQHIFQHADLLTLYRWSHALANKAEYHKRLVTFFEVAICDTFKPLQKYLTPGQHATFVLVDENQSEALLSDAQAAGIARTHTIPAVEPLKPPYISDYTWNHTMLWALKAHSDWTYLQIDFGAKPEENMMAIKETFPEEVFIHIEWALATSKWNSGTDPIQPGGAPNVKFTTPERLQEIIAFCESLGCSSTNPHVYCLEECYRKGGLQERIELKRETDPDGILNPGKMTSFPLDKLRQALVS